MNAPPSTSSSSTITDSSSSSTIVSTSSENIILSLSSSPFSASVPPTSTSTRSASSSSSSSSFSSSSSTANPSTPSPSSSSLPTMSLTRALSSSVTSSILIPKRKLLNGTEVPLLGLGTYTMRGELCQQAVKYAIQLGYRLIDTASVYRNEEDVAKGIQESGIPREQIFITSKLKPHDHGRGKAREACLGTLQRLQIKYIDLYLIHWPGVAGKNPTDPELAVIRKQTWDELVKLKNEGYIKTLGVSNYTSKHLNEFFTSPVSDASSSASSDYPLVNQFELHPLLQQRDIIDKCNAHSIHIQSYATLARGSTELLHHPDLQRIADHHQLTTAQVCLRWAIQHGYSVIPKSTHNERIMENYYALQGDDLMPEEMMIIDQLEEKFGKTLRTCWDPTGIA